MILSSYNYRKLTTVLGGALMLDRESMTKRHAVNPPESGVPLGVFMSNRHVPLIIGGICIASAVGLLVAVSGWWRYFPVGLLLMFGWTSLKTGLFASNQEIDELTGAETLSEDTAQKFKDRV